MTGEDRPTPGQPEEDVRALRRRELTRVVEILIDAVVPVTSGQLEELRQYVDQALARHVAELQAHVEQQLSRAWVEHMERDHANGALWELVDTAVALRFQDYARFLILSDRAGRISQVADQLDDAINQALEDAGEQADEAVS